MKLPKELVFGLFAIILFACNKSEKGTIIIKNDGAVFSAIKGQKSKAQSIILSNPTDKLNEVSLEITGVNKTFFKVETTLPETIEKDSNPKILLHFVPDENFIGIAEADLIVHHNSKSKIIFPLRGLSTKALEGKNEPPLFDVVKTLNFDINLGWTTLANNIKPELQGDEIPQTLFRKANSGLVEVIPVARYSPPFELPYGYYIITDTLPVKYEVDILANSKLYPEHQTLFPALKSGNKTFDPKDIAFGFYTTSPSHDAYSEDIWNKKLFKKHAAHACRIYAVKDVEGNLVENQYLVCFEEAKNGDYQDYVFLVKNIKPVSL
ncbi:hypothetical protein ACKGJY_03950 [Hyunsoonleella sp. 2307UL5-6]|uniref:hypothetical protein n=1 Tax=Hyunsoonleella sp. 2307UL5-6 TaxID=3384768 RepID=UPI0039BD7A9B